MAQGLLPYQYGEEENDSGMTALAGLPVYLDPAKVPGLVHSTRKHFGGQRKAQGWEVAQLVMSIILLNLAGGNAVSDLDILQKDEGFCRVLERCELDGMNRRERRSIQKRWRKEKRRSVPSPSSAFRFLETFHDRREEAKRVEGKAWIPEASEALKSLRKIGADLPAEIQRRNPETVATLDMDATLIETAKAEALWCYKKFKSYQPLNIWWAEQRLVAHSEFRDGNVPAGYDQLRVFKDALEKLPEGIKKVYLRSDTAGYEHKLLQYCELGKNKRYGRIEFAVGCDVTAAFKRAVNAVPDNEWKPICRKVDGRRIATGQEWAQVCFVPNGMCNTKKGRYRYFAIREPLSRPYLPGMRPELPFPAMFFENQPYKLFGTITNREDDGEAIIHWHRKRCGSSEEAHSVMKEDLAGGTLPSGKFGADAAWWEIMLPALNLNEAMKRLVLGESWTHRRLKAVRFALINKAGRVLKHGRQLWIKLSRHSHSLTWLEEIRAGIAALAPPGSA